eukprot:CAMPEP_0206051188 /NCGR_PEP_ID=MMETSP1466-20131121/30877_1 /ASSEMBLY_ACC=CAM_ASM_001126 /TAXON_ID=44452 /ORGANISM="Pavlova gyrans, Strain CCMP608" /LENGTH=132 /DNA_ID=CAMNT_0053426313 /DNA_START=45 /DNA_END=443 /DNA_ORIENTATION=-
MTAWNNGFCNCFQMQEAGCVPCCCPNMCCPCMPMWWASAMSQIKGKEEFGGNYLKCCLCAQFCPCCTFAVAYYELAEHYGIKHTHADAALKFCLPLLSFFQIMDTVMVKENLSMGFAKLVPKASVAPQEMKR